MESIEYWVLPFDQLRQPQFGRIAAGVQPPRALEPGHHARAITADFDDTLIHAGVLVDHQVDIGWQF